MFTCKPCGRLVGKLKCPDIIIHNSIKLFQRAQEQYIKEKVLKAARQRRIQSFHGEVA